MENEIINKKILEICGKYKGEFNNKAPLLYPEFVKGGILFIGFNPSYTKKAFTSVVKGNSEYKNSDMDEMFSAEKINTDFLIWFEKEAKEKYKDYFGKLNIISKKVGRKFQHIDLFYFKETSQQKVIKDGKLGFNYKDIGRLELNNFAREQLKICLDAIEAIEPEVIIVINALASRIINEHAEFFKVNGDDFDSNGFDYLEIKGRRIPIFFSCMLSGRHALDNHSFKRLVWEIKRCILKTEPFPR